MLLNNLSQKDLIHPPPFLLDNTHYLTLTGSVAYGCSSDTSDNDIYGFCIPPKDIIFPHLSGEIMGFGTESPRFWQWQEHHIEDKETRKSYDFSIYSIVKFFQLCMDNNPNMLDCLFTPINCVLHISAVGNIVRDNRKAFLHKGCWHKFKGYAYSQLHKMSIKSPEKGSNRSKTIEKYGYDVKFAYHVVRLIDEVEQILETGDMDIQRAKEVLKAIRRGEWSQQKIIDYFEHKEKHLEELYEKSKLPYAADEAKIKEILLNCLENHY